MNTSLIQDIAYSIMLHAEHDQLPIGTTKLVKLFYLIDVEYFKYHQKTLTGVPWIFYHYGPFANELIDAVQNTDGIEPTQEEFGDYKSFKSYRITRYQKDPLSSLHYSIRGIVTSVYKAWAPATLALLLDYVYYETKPMICAERCKPLDFSSILQSDDVADEPILDFSSIRQSKSMIALQCKLDAAVSQYKNRRIAKYHLSSDDLEALHLMEEDA